MNPRILLATARRVLHAAAPRPAHGRADPARAAVRPDDPALRGCSSDVAGASSTSSGRAAAGDLPVHRDVPGHLSVATLRERTVRHPRAAARHADGQGSTSCSATRSPSALVAAVQAALAVGLSRRAARPRRRRPGLGCWPWSRSPTRCSARPSACSSARSRAPSSRPCSSCRLLVFPQLLLCGLFVAARPAARRRSHAVSNVLPLSYAVDAMQELVDQRDRDRRVWRDLAHRRRLRGRRAGPGRRDPAAPYAVSPSTRSGRRTSSLVGMSLLRQPLLLLAAQRAGASARQRAMPVSRGVVRRFVAGEATEDAVRRDRASWSATACWSPSTTSARTPSTPTRPRRPVRPTSTSSAARRRGPDPAAEVSVKLSAIGQALPGDGEKIALEHARTICRARAQTPAPRSPSTWRTTPPPTRRWRPCASCAGTSPRPARCSRPTCTAPRPTAATSPTRARGCGCARAPTTSRESVAFQDRHEVDRSYVRCLKVLMAGQGYPMVATHDPRLVEIAGALAMRLRPRRRAATSSRCSTASAPTSSAAWPARARRCGSTCRTATEWYGYLMRRLAERPPNLTFFLRSLISKS